MKFTRKKKILLSILALGLTGGLGWWVYPTPYPVYPVSDHYSPERKQFFNTPESAEVSGKAFYSLWDMVVHPERFRPENPLPTLTPDWAAFLQDGEQANLIWFGHSSTLLRMDGKTVFLDPVFAEYASPVPILAKRFQPPPAALDELSPVDVIIYSHNHYDHLDKAAVRHFADKGTQFIAPLGIGALLKHWGVPENQVTELDWWDSQSLGKLQITSVPTRHDSGREGKDTRQSLWSGWVLTTPTEKIYYSGDSSYGSGEHFRTIGEHFGGFDLALIENGQYGENWPDNHMFPAQTAQAAQDVQTRRVMPVHWGAYALSVHDWREPVEKSIPLIREAGITPLTPKMGEVIRADSDTDRWWQDLR